MIPSWELTYISLKVTFEDNFPFLQVGFILNLAWSPWATLRFFPKLSWRWKGKWAGWHDPEANGWLHWEVPKSKSKPLMLNPSGTFEDCVVLVSFSMASDNMWTTFVWYLLSSLCDFLFENTAHVWQSYPTILQMLVAFRENFPMKWSTSWATETSDISRLPWTWRSSF